MRWVRTRVLPEPAPAITRTGPSPAVTASRCSSLSPSRAASAVAGLTPPTITPSSPGRRAPATGLSDGRGIACRAVGGGGAALLSGPVLVGEAGLEFGNPARQLLDRVGDRVRQVDPVRVRTLDPAPFHPYRVARIADHGGAGGHVLDHHRVGADLGPVADRDWAEQLGAGADRDAVPH